MGIWFRHQSRKIRLRSSPRDKKNKSGAKMQASDIIASVTGIFTLAALFYAIKAVQRAQEQLSISIFSEVRKNIRDSFFKYRKSDRGDRPYNRAILMNDIDYGLILMKKISDKYILHEMREHIVDIVAAFNVFSSRYDVIDENIALMEDNETFSNLSVFLKQHDKKIKNKIRVLEALHPIQ